MMRRAFELGYRRYEWKCNALNAPSRAAAQRLGFSYEGIFRQATVVKGRNRDTAWYAMIDREWPALDRAFQRWLDPANFDAEGRQRTSLSELTGPILVRNEVDQRCDTRGAPWSSASSSLRLEREAFSRAARLARKARPPMNPPMPTYQVDPTWPKPLPNHWLVGAVAGVAVDAKDHVWITHRPSTLQPNETRSFWKAAPPVLEFDQEGTLVSSWGGPGRGIRVAAARARHLRRPSGQRLARRRRRQGRADPEVHAPGQVPDADRASREERRQQRHAEPRRHGEHDRRCARPTSCTSPTAT